VGTDLLIWVLLLLGAGGVVLWHRTRAQRAAGAAPAANVNAVATAAIPNPTEFIKGTRPEHLRVLAHSDLLRVTGAERLVDHLAKRSRLSRAVFDRDLLPAIQRYAELVQLMPASESHHHSNVGGLLAHTLETVQHALLLRDGYLLPRNGGAEVIAAQRDYWTYAVFLGALLHDVGRPLTDLRIDMIQPRGAEPIRWSPLAGSLVDCQAQQYVVRFAPKGERDYQAHTKLGLVLLQRLAPATALTFLGRCPDVLTDLSKYLSGERGSALDEIISKADQHSAKANLADGSRARFASARSTPLIEQLMAAVRELVDDGSLPLNRDGAAGWVDEGSVWFVAKRLADTVREHIIARAGQDAGIPGEAKNDRLFDCWQEYRAIEKNPATDKAIWQVTVHGEDGEGYEHSLSMLRFPLGKIFTRGPESYPETMKGHIEVRAGRGPRGGEAATSSAAQGPDAGASGDHDVDLDGNVVQPPSDEGRADSRLSTPVGRAPSVRPARGEIPSPRYPQRPERPATSVAPPRTPASTPSGVGAPPKRTTVASPPAKEDLYLPEDQTARAGLRAAKSKAPTSSQPKQVSPPAAPNVQAGELTRSTLLQPDAGQLVATGKEPSAWAVKFMQWLQKGLNDGALKYNEAGAPVHFVEAGVALVTPAIFRLFVADYGEPPYKEGVDDEHHKGYGIQREVFRAGWHLLSPGDKTNIWKFSVSRRGGQAAASHLAAVVLGDPKRWFVEPPSPNLALKAVQIEAKKAA
jgi:integrating conjugative element relaxase (TIGR03760 family)